MGWEASAWHASGLAQRAVDFKILANELAKWLQSEAYLTARPPLRRNAYALGFMASLALPIHGLAPVFAA